MLIEMTVAMSVLAAIGLVVLKGSLDLMAPRQWTIYQNISDAYITYEQAYAERISFDDLVRYNSPWPVFPRRKTTTVEIGKLPGGRRVMATVIRTRIPDTNNLPSARGTGTLLTNPSETETWKVQSHLVYKIGNNQYVKSRTVVRSR